MPNPISRSPGSTADTGLELKSVAKTRSSKAGMMASFVKPIVEQMRTIWRESAEVYVGTRALHANVKAYIPKHPKEDGDDYKRRATFAELFNAYGRTIRAVVGQPFAKECSLGDDVHPDIQKEWEDLDGRGTHGDIVVQRYFWSAMLRGTAGILIDAPAVEAGLNLGQEQQLGQRPYWIEYEACDVINWRFAKIRGKMVMTMLVLKDTAEEPTTEFGDECTTRYLVYRRTAEPILNDRGMQTVTVQRYKEITKSNGETEVVPDGKVVGIPNMSRIPFRAFLPGMLTSEMTAFPPMLDLLDSNLAHFRVSTDRRWLMHLGCVPVPVRKGYKPPPQRAGEPPQARQAFGSNILMDLPNDGDFFWSEITGAAFVPTGEELKQIEQHMAALGLAFLAAETRSAETAEAKRIDKSAQSATLASSVRMLDDAVEDLLSMHAEMKGLVTPDADGNVSGGSFATSREYESILMDAKDMQVYSAMQQAGQLTLRTLWNILENGGRLTEDFDADDEEEQLALNAPAVALPDPNAPDPTDVAEPDFQSPYAPDPAPAQLPAVVPPRNAARAMTRTTQRKAAKQPAAAGA